MVVMGTTISTEGYWQQRFYAWLVMMAYPDVQRVTLKEVYVRFKAGESGQDNHRSATIDRRRLPMIERQLAVVAEGFDRAWEAYEEQREVQAEWDGETEMREQLSDRMAAINRRAEALTRPSPGGHGFAGETRLLTHAGVTTLADAAGERVRVLDRHGHWQDADVRSCGLRQLVRMTLNGGEVIRATLDHRWWRMQGNAHDGWRQTVDRVNTLEVERVPLVAVADVRIDDAAVAYGFTYGDGWHDQARHRCEVRLMPHKEEIAAYLPSGRVHRRGDGYLYCCSLPSHYKQLPERCSPDYARGFIAGLLAADGNVDSNGGVVIYCEGKGKAERIAEIARLGGCAVASVKAHASHRVPTNYSPVGTTERELATIRIKPATAPVLRAAHRANLKPTNQMRRMYRDVVSIEPSGIEEVFCAVVPGAESFTLANGVTTSSQRSRHEFSALRVRDFAP